MAKNDKQKLFDTSTAKVKQSETDYGKITGTQSDRSNTTWDRATDNYGIASKGYADYAAGGGLTPEDKARMAAAYDAVGGAGGGGISNPLSGKSSNYAGLSSAYAGAYRPDYGEADTGFRNLASSTGGFDQSKLNQIYGNVDQLSEMGRTGGITDADYNNVNRASLLEQEKTGGYSDKDIQNIRARSASSSPAFYGAMKDQQDQSRRITGNLAGASATDFKLARQAAQQQHQDKIGSEIGMQDSIRAGRSDAGKFLSDANYNLTGLRTNNQLQGAQAAGQMGLGTQQAITGNRLQGLQGLAGSQTNLGQWGLGQAGGLDQFGLSRAGGMDSWDINNAQMDMSAASSNASAGRAGAAANADYQRWLTEYGNQQKQYGLQGLTDMYNNNMGYSQGYDRLGLDAMNSKFDTQGMMLGHATQNRGSTMMENAQTIGNMAGGIIGTATGLSGLGGLAGGGPQMDPSKYGATGPTSSELVRRQG